MLTEAQIRPVLGDGCVFPVRVMPEAEALAFRRELEAFEATTGGPLQGDLRHKSHLLFSKLADLVRNSRIVDAIEDLYGRICCAGRPTFSSRRLTIRRSFHGTRIRPTGA